MKRQKQIKMSKVQVGSLSDIGMKRSGNQDACHTLQTPHVPLGGNSLLIVADGMGGHRAGDVASKLAVSEFVATLENRADQATLKDKTGAQDRLKNAVKAANAAVHRAGEKPEYQGMGTTFTSVFLAGQTAIVSHVGDSRAYLFRDGELVQITRDHSWVAEQVAAGVLKPELAANHPQKNVLTRALGIDLNVEVDSESVTAVDGDVFLLCSDGLHGLVSDDEISGYLQSNGPQRICKDLVDLANSRGGHDNITVVVAIIGPRIKRNSKKTEKTRLMKSSQNETTTVTTQARKRRNPLRFLRNLFLGGKKKR